MNYSFYKESRFLSLVTLTFIIVFSSCEREVSDDAVLATYPNTADIFTDAPVGLTNDFFKSFDPATGANTKGFGVDNTVAKVGRTSIRIDVPAPKDLDGGYIGGIFKDRGAGRNLTGYDALTFWVKGSTTATIAEVGFGTDFEGNKHAVTLKDIQLSTDWRKIIIPIPDASKLTKEKGMFIFSAGTTSTAGVGYTFWIDEIRFEKLGTIKLINPTILNGQDVVVNGFVGSNQVINQLSATYNLSDGKNIAINVAPAYFNFATSNDKVCTVNQLGLVKVVGTSGTTVISASVGTSLAKGSLKFTSNGTFPQPQTPTNPAANVRSVFSNAYTNLVTANFDPKFGGSTTTANIESINGNDVVRFSNNNYTGILFDSTPINGSTMTFMHVDVYVQVASSLEFQIRDIGANKTLETNVNTGFPSGDDKDYRFTANGLVAGWNSINIPLAGNLASQKNNLGSIVLVGGPDFILDNIYFFLP
jgi:hypothetical protein